MGETCTSRLTLKNRSGLHARPATDFATTAAGFTAEVVVRANNEQADGKSVMELMLLAATQGTELEVVCTGDDARACLDHLAALVARGFDED